MQMCIGYTIGEGSGLVQLCLSLELQIEKDEFPAGASDPLYHPADPEHRP